MRHNVAVIVLLLSATSLGAQQAWSGILEGTLSEKVSSRSMRGATLSVARLDSDAVALNVSPDARGHYRVETLAAGRYIVQLTTPALDSLSLALPPRELLVAPGETVHADFEIPSGTVLRDAVCAGLSLGKGKAVVAGHAVDADTESPIAGGEVVVSWSVLTVDSTLKAASRDRVARVQTGPRGEYRLCGVPTDTWLDMQLQLAGHAGAAVRVSVSEEEGAVVRNLSLSKADAPTLAALDSAEDDARRNVSDSYGAGLRLTGTASVTGTVRGPNGQPLLSAEVRVRDAAGSTVTNEAGRFVLGRLPAGTQVMLVRHLGYSLTEVPVELRADRSVTHDIQLTRVVSLDSIRVVALRTMYPEFEFDRRAYFLGRFVTLDEIERKKPTETSDLFTSLGGFTVVGHGPGAMIASNVAKFSHPGCGALRVVIDGVEGMAVNDVPPNQVAGIEAYREGEFAPGAYAARGNCGVVIIWTKSSARDQKRKKPADKL